MKTISFKSLLITLMLSLLGGVMFSATAGLSALPTAGALFGASLLKGKDGVAMMAVNKEIWIEDIVGNLFKTNPHLKFAFNADAFVLQGKVVHIPNAGAKPAVKRNRENFPATVVLRQDSDITFVMDEYTTDPVKIENADKYELSYDKRRSVIGDQSDALSELVGDWFLRYWSPSLAAQIKRTTGDAEAAHLPSATGNRKKITVIDVKRMQKEFNKQNIPNGNRYAMLDADMYDQFTDDLSISQEREFSKALNEETGVVGKLFGFTFLEPRSTALRYDNTGTPVALDPDADANTTDNAAALFWHKELVIRAMGTKEFFDNEGDPEHYGDIYSALLRSGGRIKREDGKGVFALVQTATA